MDTEGIQDNAPINKYFHMMLNMDDDDLDPYEYRLLGHYRRVGTCFEGIRTTAEKCKMSTGQVSEVRQRLVAKGYLAIEDRENNSSVVIVLDRMAENVARYAPNQGVHEVNGGVHQVKQRRTSSKKNKDSLAPQATQEKKPRPRNKLFDAIAFGSFGLSEVPKASGGRVAKLVREVCAIKFREDKPTPEQIAELAADLTSMYAWFGREYPHLSAPASDVTICKYLAEWRAISAPKPQFVEVVVPYEPPYMPKVDATW